MRIEVCHTADRSKYYGMIEYDLNYGSLAIPNHLHIGRKGDDGKLIKNYAQQVDEYGIWLEDCIKYKDKIVRAALGSIYELAQSNEGVVLHCACMPSPYITHAHVVRRIIKEIAGE